MDTLRIFLGGRSALPPSPASAQGPKHPLRGSQGSPATFSTPSTPSTTTHSKGSFGRRHPYAIIRARPVLLVRHADARRCCASSAWVILGSDWVTSGTPSASTARTGTARPPGSGFRVRARMSGIRGSRNRRHVYPVAVFRFGPHVRLRQLPVPDLPPALPRCDRLHVPRSHDGRSRRAAPRRRPANSRTAVLSAHVG